MKKILFSLILLILINFNIYGESYTIPLSYEVSPSYVVTIPKVVDITNNETKFNFTVCGDIYYDYYLEVLFDSNATVTHNNSSTNVNVSQSKTNFSYEELLNTSSASVTLSHETLRAGTWTGELHLLISLKEGTYQ